MYKGNIDRIVWENGKQMFISYSIHYVQVPVVFIFEYFRKGFYCGMAFSTFIFLGKKFMY